MGRVALAFAVAVSVFPFFILISGMPDAWGGALRVGGFTAGGVLGLGLPAFWFFRCRGWWRLRQFVAGGAIGGLLCTFIFMRIDDLANLAFFAILFAAGGAAHALLFWFIAVWRNRQLTIPAKYCLPGGVIYRVSHRALRNLGRGQP